MSIKDIVKDKTVSFVRYSGKSKTLLYITECGMEFPVPISDTGDGVFKAKDKAILYMRYIRKQLELIDEALANDK